MASIITSAQTIDLGRIQSETQTKSSEMFNFPVPVADSNESIVLDLFGVSRRISVTGIITGNLAQLNTFITDIETIKNGTQGGETFVSSLTTFPNKTVYIKNFDWTYSRGSPNKIDYTLELLEGLSS